MLLPCCDLAEAPAPHHLVPVMSRSRSNVADTNRQPIQVDHPARRGVKTSWAGSSGKRMSADALGALGEELVDSDRPFITVSATPVVPGRVSTEADPLPPDGPVGGRNRSVMSVLELASRGVRSATVRLPRTVHNEGKGGFAGALTDTARRTGVSGYPGDGTRRWPAVH